MTGTAIDRFREALHGVGITPATPFTDDLSAVDHDGLRRNIEFLIDGGATLLYPCGNTGEFPALSLDEWTDVVRITVEVAGDRATVAPGVGHGFGVALEQLHRAADLGARGVLAMPPNLVYPADEGVVAYYGALTDADVLPVVVYRKGGWPTNAGLPRLLGGHQVAGVKYGEQDVSALAGMVAGSPPDVVWTAGTAERYAPYFWEAGAIGFTSGLANAAPHIALGMYEALAGGDMARALEIRDLAVPFENLRARYASANNVPAVKVAMDAVGLAGGGVRPPMRDLAPAEADEVRAMVHGWPKEMS
ncbi:dihydrodipicolinate synthase family protein [bacterium]|nr:dihydrodipicolinate synthase family protein [bacterium]